MTTSSRAVCRQDIVTFVRKLMLSRKFLPYPLLTNGHLMTLAGDLLNRNFGNLSHIATRRLFQVDSESKIVARCGWQPNWQRAPTMILVHGLEGSSESKYLIGTALKGYAAGFNVIRLNQRGCGEGIELSPTSYHAGSSEDIRRVLDELVLEDGLEELYICGFSLGGNQVLKLAGEYADNPPTALRAVCAVSTPIDLAASSDALHLWTNRLYEMRFLLSLQRSYQYRKKLYSDRYPKDSRYYLSLREFDDKIAGPLHGFKGADDYYAATSSNHILHKIKLPTLIIQSEDDPFIPFEQYRQSKLSDCCILLATKHGGHVGFIGRSNSLEDNFWAENRVVEFFKAIHILPKIGQAFQI
ncbi:MAG: alpha/beta fold hydrolase [Acidobacteriota bacterium]|nr:alpha/beta fold hydrolase [Blastocatellia bacterium]MDW8411058.1 alpha/beta fold hydrolase [Acidobacteriota bacterium]